MPEQVTQAAAVERIARLADDHVNDTVLIGIDGCGGAGKSTFADRIAADVPRAVVIHVDDFAGPAIAEWDWRRFRAQVLVPLLAGRPARYQRWDWPTDTGAEWHDVPVGQVVLVEGVSATRREVAAPWALTVWVDAGRDIRLERAVERDGTAQLERWLTEWMPSEDAYVAREHPQARADLIVSGTEVLPVVAAG